MSVFHPEVFGAVLHGVLDPVGRPVDREALAGELHGSHLAGRLLGDLAVADYATMREECDLVGWILKKIKINLDKQRQID